MTLDMSQFHDAFFEEGFESLDAMEAALLELDPRSPNAEAINSVFRVAHSLKGGSGMFGFTEITSFTHTLETLLDELRGGRKVVSSGIVDLLLKSTDVLRGMLQATQRKTPIDQQAVADLQFDLELQVAQGPGSVQEKEPEATPLQTQDKAAPPVVGDPAVAAGPERPAGEQAHPGGTTWQIELTPNPRLLVLGNDPQRMLGELAALGDLECLVETAHVPTLADIDPEVCYLSWRLMLTTEVTQEVIRSVFEWVEGDCELLIEALPAPGPAVEAVNIPSGAGSRPEPVSTPAAASTLPGAAPGIAPESGSSRVPRTETAAENARSASSDSNSIRVSIDKIDELMNTVGEIVITQSMLMQFAQGGDAASFERLRTGLGQLERNVRELQETVMRVRMLPISFVFSRFPRMVRDLAQKLGKEIELKMTGEQTELDKTVLEKIGDPLVHLVRNCVDHGVESTAARLAAGKSAQGTVCLEASHRGGNIAVEVSDDGAGLDKDRIVAKARERGLIGASEVLTDEQIYELIFLPGFSTAEKTTDVSGRGVGMDVVRRNIKALGGKINISSERGKGSRFAITLPLTLAIVDGQSVAVGTESYIVPLISIIESLQVRPSQVNSLPGRGEVLSFRGDYLPIIRLHAVFGVAARAHRLEEGLVVVAEGDGQRVGLFVDDLLGQQQVVIKSLETNYGHVEGVSGATILGDGSVALILDLPGLIRTASTRVAA
jgi:two-component system, chemotaxis family, sensor kinase CheA